MSEQRPATIPKAESASAKRYTKESLFGSAKEIIIQHGSLDYRLRETRNGKLILNL